MTPPLRDLIRRLRGPLATAVLGVMALGLLLTALSAGGVSTLSLASSRAMVSPDGPATSEPTSTPTDDPTGVPTDEPTGGPTAEPTPVPVPASAPIRLAQANLKMGLTVPKFQADVATVFAQQPDFVTYNEVAHRQDAVLAPSGYAIYRTPGAYTGEDPVVWNTSRWTELASGTTMLSNRHGRTKWQKYDWGIRYANWVTLESSAGQVVSVIAAHLAPKTKITDGLLEPSLRRLGALATQLNAQGPVMIGGDFNVNYKAVAEYPRDLIDSLGLVPTYDVLGSALPTGDYRNSTIDYVFLRSASQFQVQDQSVTDLNSDHRLLVADVALTGAAASAFVPGTVVSDPRTSPRVVLTKVKEVLAKAPAGASIHLVSRQLSGDGMFKAIAAAHKRGVHVQVLTGRRSLTHVERKLARLLGTKVRKKSWAVSRPAAWKRFGLPAAAVLASVSGGTPAIRVDLSRALVPLSTLHSMRAEITTTKSDYDALFRTFMRAAHSS